MEPDEHLGTTWVPCAGKANCRRADKDGCSDTPVRASQTSSGAPVMARDRETRRRLVGASVSSVNKAELRAHDGGTRPNRLASFTTAIPAWLVPLGCDFVRRENSNNNNDPSDFVSRLLDSAAAEPSKDAKA